MTENTPPEGESGLPAPPNDEDARRSVEIPAQADAAAQQPQAETTRSADLTGSFAVLLEDSLRRLDRVETALRDVSHRYSGRIEDRSNRAFIEALKLAAQGTRQLVRQRE